MVPGVIKLTTGVRMQWFSPGNLEKLEPYMNNQYNNQYNSLKHVI